jgi:exodeoxyribonuclease-1
MVEPSFYWYDYETFGADPRRDRPAQFAGVRTDRDLNPIEDPLVLYCKPAADMLPHPEACLLTGITPQKALAKGVPEAEFVRAIHAEFARPGTCTVGYNAIRFDDELTRHLLYRNFFDPYAREWQNGNSRWDIIDMARLMRALRPEGIEWPETADGKPSFRLEHLAAANGLAHGSAHDALADVYATIALAGLIRKRQPRLYDYVFGHRSKGHVAGLLRLGSLSPLLHVSEKFPAAQGCLAVVVPLAPHPVNSNGVIAYSLHADPAPLVTLGPAEIHQRVFTAATELPHPDERIPLKTIHLNKCPIVVPMNALRPDDSRRLGIDLAQCHAHLERIRHATGLVDKIQQAFRMHLFETEQDVDLMLYSGGFFSNADRLRMEHIRSVAPSELGRIRPNFDDARLPEMLFRYRARNYPHSLSPDERSLWEEYRVKRLTVRGCGSSLTLSEYWKLIDALRADPKRIQGKEAILKDLIEYGRQIIGQPGAVAL